MEEKIMQIILSAEDSIKIKVRFNDTDAMGIVHFKNYLVYFDDGFVSFMNNIQNPLAIENAVRKGIVFPVKKITITYEGSAEFGDHVIVKTRIKNLGEKSMTFLHDIYRESDNALLAKVECTRVVMELSTKELLNVKKFLADFV
ncbi:MAG: acyl-CoA thioesterase [Promethearchaeota archaeon]|nr:MAG: acyl-CoA thioesterase [Candidatus Lokiarchaeota archaeon]